MSTSALRNADGVVTLIARDAYLTQIREKKMGGHPRSIAIEQVDILDDAIANAKVTLRSDVMRFDTYFALVKRSSGPWQIIDYLLITKPLQS